MDPSAPQIDPSAPKMSQGVPPKAPQWLTKASQTLPNPETNHRWESHGTHLGPKVTPRAPRVVICIDFWRFLGQWFVDFYQNRLEKQPEAHENNKNNLSNPKAKNCKEPCTPSEPPKRNKTSRCGGVASAFSIRLYRIIYCCLDLYNAFLNLYANLLTYMLYV